MNLQNRASVLTTKISLKLKHDVFFKLAEILVVFLVAFGIIRLLQPIAGNNAVMKQAVVWFANVIMLLIIGAGVKLRGQGLESLGLNFTAFSKKKVVKTFAQSLLIFVLAVSAFILGSVIIAPITGIPESANLSGYEYLKNNIWMLLLTLAGVYIVSSIGEEIIYRAFLINRFSSLIGNRKYATTIAVIFSAIVFGLIHFEWGLMGIVQTGLMGIVLAISYIKLNKKLWPLILAHAYLDTILMVQMYLSGN